MLVALAQTGLPSTPAVELALFPAQVQVNGASVLHAGTFGAASWRVREGVAVQVLGGGNWLARETAFQSEVVNTFRTEATTAQAMLWRWATFGGVELTPLRGELSLLEGAAVRFGVVVDVGLGAGGTQVRLSTGAMGDTGVRAMSTFGLGVRVDLGSHLTLRLGARDIAFGGGVDTVNGCPGASLLAIDPTRPEPAGCRGFATPAEADAARARVALQTSPFLHDLSFTAGLGVTL